MNHTDERLNGHAKQKNIGEKKMFDTLDQIVDNYYLNAEMPNYEE